MWLKCFPKFLLDDSSNVLDRILLYWLTLDFSPLNPCGMFNLNFNAGNYKIVFTIYARKHIFLNHGVNPW